MSLPKRVSLFRETGFCGQRQRPPERDVRTKFSSTETKRRCGSAPNRSYSRGSRKSLLARECVVALRGNSNRQPNGYELRLPMNVFGRASIEAETNGSVFPCECPVKHRDLFGNWRPGEISNSRPPDSCSLMTPITHPIVRAPWPAGYCSRRAHRGLEIKAAADPARGGAPRNSRRTLGTSLEPFGEHPCS